MMLTIRPSGPFHRELKRIMQQSTHKGSPKSEAVLSLWDCLEIIAPFLLLWLLSLFRPTGSYHSLLTGHAVYSQDCSSPNG